tara:strand:+ start:2690 stop:5866 length:3177 start_codon:yes stop_codon:yes gene_type:complete
MSAQSRTIVSGTIVGEAEGVPLTGATIAEVDKDNRIISGVVADFNGNYSIALKNANNKLTFSYVGYVTKEVIPGNQTTIDIRLKEDISELDVIMLRGRAKQKAFTGEFEMEKRRIATAMETINMEEVSETVSTGIVDQLQGRLSGVDIVANSGEPGAGMSIRIRGTSSLNASSEPLIVINGVPFETEIDNLFDFGSADEQQYAAMIGVSPNDIEEISVLKDAAATAQYGSRAANGVLLIKTKRGAKGPAQFSYSYRGSVGWQPEGIPMLNGDQYSTLIKDELIAVNNTVTYPQIEYDPGYELYNLYNKNINWIDEITQTGKTQEHFLGVSGGGEKSNYRVSASYKDQLGTTIGSAFKLFTTRAILDYNISDKIKISSELSYTHGSLDRSSPGIRGLALLKMPNQSIYQVDEDGGLTNQYFTPINAFQGSGSDYYNPVAMARLSKFNVENNRITPIFRFNYKPMDALDFRSIISFDINVDKTSRFVPEEAIGAAWTNGSANNAIFGDAEFFVMRTDNRLIWKPNLGDEDKHSLFTSAAVQTFEKTSQGYSVETSNSPSSYIQTPIALTRIEGNGNSLGSSFTQNRTVAYNFMFNYQFLDRYILSGGIRSEGNSKFGSSYRYGAFPSLAGKWILSSEPFMENLDFIDELGIRGSYGVNGNSPNFNYGQYNTYSTYGYNYLDERPVRPDNMELTDLRWETVIQKNIGLTYSFFNRRLSGDLEFYQKDTRDMLTPNTSIPSTTGFSSLPYLNLGDISNEGFELSIRTKVVQHEDFELDINFNIARNRNLIKRITDAQDVEDGNALATGPNGYLKRIQEGNPIGSFYGYRYLGVYSTSDDVVARDENGDIIYDINGQPKDMVFNSNSSAIFQAGDAKYEDVNKDGSIDRLDVVYIGNANPLLFGGFGPNIRYKNFQLNAFFNYRFNQKIINIARMNAESMDSFDNQSTSTLRRWRFEGNQTDIPRAEFNSPVNTLGSDRFLEDGSFLRLKFVTLRYNLPKAFLKKINFNYASVFVTGSNLLTFTKYSGADPETGNSSKWQSLGYDNNQTPRSQEITLGLNLTF